MTNVNPGMDSLHGNHEPAPDAPAAARLRAQACNWLNADLAGWAKLLESGSTDDRAVVSALNIWKNDTELLGVRDAQALRRIPDAERAAWQELWVAVDELLRRTGAGGPLKPTAPAGALPADPFAR